jgi:hypothetical protein
VEIEPALDGTRKASVPQVFVRKPATARPTHIWPHHLGVATAHFDAVISVILLMLRRILDNLRRRSLTRTSTRNRAGNGLQGLVRSLVLGTQPLVTRAQVPTTKPAEDVRVQGGSPGFVTKASGGQRREDAKPHSTLLHEY